MFIAGKFIELNDRFSIAMLEPWEAQSSQSSLHQLMFPCLPDLSDRRCPGNSWMVFRMFWNAGAERAAVGAPTQAVSAMRNGW